MSKELEALELLISKGLMNANYELTKETPEYKIIKQALKRNIPLLRHGNDCPTCGLDFEYRDNYCGNCGQKIDWSDKL